MINKIEQTPNSIISTIIEENKESKLIQEVDEDNFTHIIHETKKKTGNITITKRIEYTL